MERAKDGKGMEGGEGKKGKEKEKGGECNLGGAVVSMALGEIDATVAVIQCHRFCSPIRESQ